MSPIHTLKEHKNFRYFQGCHKFLIDFLQWWSMRKYIWRHTQITNAFDTKAIRCDSPVYLGMPLILMIFNSWNIYEYQSHPQINGILQIQKPSINKCNAILLWILSPVQLSLLLSDPQLFDQVQLCCKDMGSPRTNLDGSIINVFQL